MRIKGEAKKKKTKTPALPDFGEQIPPIGCRVDLTCTCYIYMEQMIYLINRGEDRGGLVCNKPTIVAELTGSLRVALDHPSPPLCSRFCDSLFLSPPPPPFYLIRVNY